MHPDIIVFMLDYDGCTAPSSNTTTPPTEKIIEKIADALREYPNARIILKPGSFRQSIYLNWGNWLQNQNGCCFAALKKILHDFKMQHPHFATQIDIDPFILEDMVDAQKTTGAPVVKRYFEKACSLNTLERTEKFIQNLKNRNELLWHDEHKIAELYAHMQQCAREHPTKNILFYYFDDREEIHNHLMAAFRRCIPKYMPTNIVLQTIHCVHGNVGHHYHPIYGLGDIDENYVDMATIIHTLYLLSSQPKALSPTALPRLIEKCGLEFVIDAISKIGNEEHKQILFAKLPWIVIQKQGWDRIPRIAQYLTISQWIELMCLLIDLGAEHKQAGDLLEQLCRELHVLSLSNKKTVVQLIQLHKHFQKQLITLDSIKNILDVLQNCDGPLKEIQRNLRHFYCQLSVLAEPITDETMYVLNLIINTPHHMHGDKITVKIFCGILKKLLYDTKTFYMVSPLPTDNYSNVYRYYKPYRHVMFGISPQEAVYAQDAQLFIKAHCENTCEGLHNYNVTSKNTLDTKIKIIASSIDKQSSQTTDPACHAAYYALRLMITTECFKDSNQICELIMKWRQAPNIIPNKNNGDVLDENDALLAQKQLMLFRPTKHVDFCRALIGLIERLYDIKNNVVHDRQVKQSCVIA